MTEAESEKEPPAPSPPPLARQREAWVEARRPLEKKLGRRIEHTRTGGSPKRFQILVRVKPGLRAAWARKLIETKLTSAEVFSALVQAWLSGAVVIRHDGTWDVRHREIKVRDRNLGPLPDALMPSPGPRRHKDGSWGTFEVWEEHTTWVEAHPTEAATGAGGMLGGGTVSAHARRIIQRMVRWLADEGRITDKPRKQAPWKWRPDSPDLDVIREFLRSGESVEWWRRETEGFR